MESLRALALKGGVYTGLRQLAGMAISFAGLAALVRLIGPAAYGVYVSAFALAAYAQVLLALGIDVFLVRKVDMPEPDDLHQGFTLALAAGTVGFLLALPGSRLAEDWIGVAGVRDAVLALFACLPLQLATLVPSAVLQRRMDWKGIAQAELAGLLAFQVAALGLAAWDGGTAAPVAGFWAQQATTTALLLRRSGYRPRLRWRPNRLRPMLTYGVPFAAATWMWHLRGLTTPLVVARLLGPEAAAAVGIGVRIAESLSFMRLVAWRVSIPALSHLQRQPERLAAAVAQGALAQLAITGPAMLAFRLAAPWVIPLAFGRDWPLLVGLFPFLATAYLANCLFGLHFAALHVAGRNVEAGAVHLLHALLLMGTAELLAPHLGGLAYGWAEMAALAAYALLHLMVRLRIGEVPLALALAWALAAAAALFAERLGPWAWLGLPVVLLLPATRRLLDRWRTELVGHFMPKESASDDAKP
ncbi:MAG: oligosaccharide flippase family protein [Magnetospirillum sp.]|nr:oligosaccharide flippase family protein [Magnetospirillum sp.]